MENYVRVACSHLVILQKLFNFNFSCDSFTEIRFVAFVYGSRFTVNIQFRKMCTIINVNNNNNINGTTMSNIFIPFRWLAFI